MRLVSKNGQNLCFLADILLFLETTGTFFGHERTKLAILADILLLLVKANKVCLTRKAKIMLLARYSSIARDWLTAVFCYERRSILLVCQHSAIIGN